MTPFSIVCAYKDLGDPHRRRAFEFTRRYWQRWFPEAEILCGEPDVFTRAAGLNLAVKYADHDLILQADPDTVAPPAQIREALRLASERDGLVVPFSEYMYLDENATRLLHAWSLDGMPTFTAEQCQQHGFGGCGPITVYSRRTWETVVGYDERFGLWGGDDGAFAYSCDAYFGELRRVDGPCWHSYHPRLPQSVPGGEGYVDGFVLLGEYRDAAAEGPDAVKAMIEARW